MAAKNNMAAKPKWRLKQNGVQNKMATKWKIIRSNKEV